MGRATKGTIFRGQLGAARLPLEDLSHWSQEFKKHLSYRGTKKTEWIIPSCLAQEQTGYPHWNKHSTWKHGPKRKVVFQPSIYRCYSSFREGRYALPLKKKKKTSTLWQDSVIVVAVIVVNVLVIVTDVTLTDVVVRVVLVFDVVVSVWVWVTRVVVTIT